MADSLNTRQEQIRGDLVDAVRQLLIGPFAEDEVLRNVPPGVDPSDYYLTGILWPRYMELEGEDDEALEVEDDEQDGVPEDTGTPLYSVFKPSSIGLTCAVADVTQLIEIIAEGARYTPREPEGDAESDGEDVTPPAGDEEAGEGNGEASPGPIDWVREPFCYRLTVDPAETRFSWLTDEFLLPDGTTKRDEGISIHVKRRESNGLVVITASLINMARREEGQSPGSICLFQTRLAIQARDTSGRGVIVTRPPAATFPDEDMKSGDLLYRNCHEFAAGHGIAAAWEEPRDATVGQVRTDWMPTQKVYAMSRAGHEDLAPLISGGGLPFAAADLARQELRDQTIEGLKAFCSIYGKWIDSQEKRIPTELTAYQQETARKNLQPCRKAFERMEQGVRLLETNGGDAFRAFCLANEAMNVQASGPHRGDKGRPLVWFPFQLAFILMAVESIVRGDHEDRLTMDLLWFPTGGGKTEAYLGLVAFTIFLRRILQDGDDARHVDVLMRYTLRLLTVQQFQRASAMICAADRIRDREGDLGSEPISIGLYVGQGATPNRLLEGKVNAKELLEEERNGNEPACTPRLLLNCPLCGASLPISCYDIDDAIPELQIRCPNAGCASGGKPLPVYTVDDDIYRVRPSLLIGTVDKFAQLPRKREQGLLFGRPDGLPPELIIQDELHLISGPLGTVTGLYETCIDLLCAADRPRPKIIGSTATIGRASQQVRGLFDRDVLQFPPAAIDAENSFFAVQDRDAPDRLYMAISSAGRSPKFTLQASAAAFLSVSQALLDKGADEKALDPYWTLLLYFNSLRELGGAKVMMRDDVPRTLRFHAGRLSASERQLQEEPLEITSRIPSTRIPKVLQDLEFPLDGDTMKGEAVNSALASNMISVGMDIPRLGLMLVNGQPKSTSEYIQATSRVGRGIPGLILTSLNAARPRDMSHFEHFTHFHQTLYRRVEVTSVTPWSSRARDRALHAVFISAVRHLIPGMADRFAPISFDPTHPAVTEIREWIRQRAASCGLVYASSTEVLDEVERIIDRWHTRAGVYQAGGKRLEYWATLRPYDNKPTNPHLMRGAEDVDVDPQVWPTPNSMREVEPSAWYVLWPEKEREA